MYFIGSVHFEAAQIIFQASSSFLDSKRSLMHINEHVYVNMQELAKGFFPFLQFLASRKKLLYNKYNDK